MSPAIGLLPHTGWAWLVRVRGRRDAPVVEARARVAACEVLEGQLYHHARDDADLARARAVALSRTRAALHALIAGARAAVVLGKTARLPATDRILAAHPLVHAAEGELWRQLFADACAAEGVTCHRAEAGEVEAALVARHGRARVETFLRDARATLGAPWPREVQHAALAAWSALS